MGRMGSSKGGRRARRQFSEEFRDGAVRLVLDEGKTIGAVARELDLTPSSLANWVRHAQADRTKGRTGLTTEERAAFAGREWGPTRVCRSDEGADGADDRGARRAGGPAQRKPRAADGARHPKKSRGGFKASMQRRSPVYQQVCGNPASCAGAC